MCQDNIFSSVIVNSSLFFTPVHKKIVTFLPSEYALSCYFVVGVQLFVGTVLALVAVHVHYQCDVYGC